MAKEELADVFAFPDFDLSTKCPNLPANLQDQFFGLDVVKAIHKPANHIFDSPETSTTTAAGFFNLPVDLVPLGSVGHESRDRDLDHVTEPLHDAALPDLDIVDELWYEDEIPPAPNAEYKTWDAFSSSGPPPQAPLFITEAGPLVYDAAILDPGDPLGLKSTDHLIIQTKPYLAALLGVSLGRGSVFFVWDARKAAFVPAVEESRISGYSTEILQGLQNSCLRSGTTTRFLSSYVQLTYRTRPGAVRVALAKTVDVILLSVQRQSGERGKHVRSMLQLQSLVEPVETMLVYLRELVHKVSRIRTDEQILSHIFSETEVLENDRSLLRALMCEVLSRVTEPWLDFAEKWIGVKGEEGFPMSKDGPGKCFVEVRDIMKVDDFGFEAEERDYVLNEARVPNFMPTDIALVMFEAGKNLRLLRTHHPDHPLCDVGIVASRGPPKLKWLFDWGSIETLQNEAGRYEKAMQLKILGGPAGDHPPHKSDTHVTSTSDGMLQAFGNDGADLERQLLASIQTLDHMSPPTATQDELSSLLEESLLPQHNQTGGKASNFDLHWSLIPLHSFGPLIVSQARLINREYMKFLFNAHKLREHLSIQKEFQLFGNGMFCSRLSHALFDPDLETAERQAGVALNGGVMGLRMNGRDTWPPASSELRLALMGVLSETYTSSAPQELYPSGPETNNLPGELSFALRDLPPEEIDKCMDPSSLEALDFLRLAYKTPEPLSPILTPVILIKYDKIFKILLRIIRLLYVVGQLFRDTSKMERQGRSPGAMWLRFRFEAQHLVQSVATYFFDTGIQVSWLQFEGWLDGVESDLARDGTDILNAVVVSPDVVREEHEKMLDRITNVLLLRKRQQPVMALLEEIFKLILKFSRQIQLEVGNKVEDGASEAIVQELYKAFRKKVQVFVTVCHGLREKASATSKGTKRDPAYDDERRSDGVVYENTIDKLLVNLDMFNYYSRPRF